MAPPVAPALIIAANDRRHLDQEKFEPLLHRGPRRAGDRWALWHLSLLPPQDHGEWGIVPTRKRPKPVGDLQPLT